MSAGTLLEPSVVGDGLTSAPPGPLSGGDWRRRAVPALAALGVLNVAAAAQHVVAAEVIALLLLLLLPGALALAVARVRPRSGSIRVAYAVTSSLLTLMVIALAESVLLPPVGIARPFTIGPLLAAVDLVCLALTAIAAHHVEPLGSFVGRAAPTGPGARIGLALGAVVLLAAAGAERLNAGMGSALAIAANVVAGATLLGAIIVGERVPKWVQSGVLWAVAAALMLAYSLRSNHVFGFDIQQEISVAAATLKAGVWRVPADHSAYSAMLSITALPAMLTKLTGISATWQFKLVFPLVFALFPVLSFEIATRWVPRLPAFAAVSSIVATAAFSDGMPQLARQEIGLLFFAVLVCVAFDPELTHRRRQVGVCLAAAGMSVTHYSTAYASMFAVISGYLLYGLVRLCRRLRRRERTRRAVLTLPVVALMAVAVWGWNAGITRSTSNVSNFLTEASTLGPDLLPTAKGSSVVNRWINGVNPQKITATAFFHDLSTQYSQLHPWIVRYPQSLTDQYPGVTAHGPVWPARVPVVASASAVASPVAAEFFLFATVVGLLAFVWTRRRDDRRDQLEFAAVGLGFLAFVGFVRVSGAAIETYNPERAQIHSSVPLAVGLAVALGWLLSRRRRWLVAIATAGIVVATAVVFVTGAGSGLAALVGGGGATVNLASKGDDYERLYVTDQDAAAAVWLRANQEPGSLIWADRYGALRVLANFPPGTAVFDGLTPATVDIHAYVYASTANIADNRARGATDGAKDSVTYVFPADFFNTNKGVVYSTATTRIYK